MRLLGTVHLPASTRPGESVALWVSDQNGVPFAYDDDEEVSVNGQIGAKQYVQFAYPGDYSLLVLLRDRHGVLLDSASVVLSVSGDAVVYDAESGLSLPLLQAVPSLVRPYEIRFVLGERLPPLHPQYVQKTAEFPKDRSYTWRVNTEPPVITKQPYVDIDCLWRTDHNRQYSTVDVSVHILPGNVTARKTFSLSSLPFSNQSRAMCSPLVRGDERATIGDGVVVYGELFEGTSERTSDLDGTGSSNPKIVAPGETGDLQFSLTNQAETTPGDNATLTLRILNLPLAASTHGHAP